MVKDMATEPLSPPDPQAQCNHVVLTGRVAAEAVERELPSGDTIVTARVIVDRDTARDNKPGPRVDAIDCVAWGARPQRTMRTWQPGEIVNVEGALRRRFYRVPSGPVSRVEVEVTRARRVRS
jgi:single-strand DNA-binding protein